MRRHAAYSTIFPPFWQTQRTDWCDCKLLTARRVKPRIRPPLRSGELPLRFVARVCASPSRQDSVFDLPCHGAGLWLRTTSLLRLQTLSPHSRHFPVPSLEPHCPSQAKKRILDPAPSAPRLRPRAPRRVRAHGEGRAEDDTMCVGDALPPRGTARFVQGVKWGLVPSEFSVPSPSRLTKTTRFGRSRPSKRSPPCLL